MGDKDVRLPEVPAELHAWLRVEAARHGLTLPKFIIQVLAGVREEHWLRESASMQPLFSTLGA